MTDLECEALTLECGLLVLSKMTRLLSKVVKKRPRHFITDKDGVDVGFLISLLYEATVEVMELEEMKPTPEEIN